VIREANVDDRCATETLQRLFDETIVAVVRLPSSRNGLPAIRALLDGGVAVTEIAITTPDAMNLISQVRDGLPHATVGAGSVLTCNDVDRCADAGAEFLVSPVLDPDVLHHALSRGLPFSPGTFTPTEAHAAWCLGAPLVKVFPAARLGPKFVSDLKAPLPFLRLMPTGGITSETVADFLEAGADVIGAGSWLTPSDAVASGDFDLIRDRAAQLRAAVSQASKAEVR
jgi:2-dehydro-3-deoxyphosphogluconate aldolase/(4S)-4-hydroxy-2-oxoglutarate aldolase